MKKILFSLAVLLFSFNVSNACSCGGESAFCDVNQANPTHHVFIGKIVMQDSNYAKMEILERIRGIELIDTITIWDYNDSFPGINCFSVAANTVGNVGDSILIILGKINSLDSTNQHAQIGDYFTPSNFCARPVIGIRNQLIIGNITKSHPFTSPLTPYVIDSISINDFKNQFNTSPGVQDCDITLGVINPALSNNVLTIYPNPSTGIINIDSKAPVSVVRVFSILGNEVEIKTANYSQLDLSGLSRGVYFIEVKFSQGEKISKKVILD